MFPQDKTVDLVYRRYMGHNGKRMSRLDKIQCRLAALAFSLPPLPMSEVMTDCGMSELNLSFDFVCRSRGKVVMRSDWSKDAMWFTLDARADGFLIGHDSNSRGNFVLGVGGKTWGICPEWNQYPESSNYSLPAINGEGQQGKASFARLLDVHRGEKFTFASADLTYTYNWKWTGWGKKSDDHIGRGFERETSDPHDFGYDVWWAPNQIYDESNVGFQGLHVWRKRFAEVEKVVRSALMVRGRTPFIVISDYLKKDDGDEVHEYRWAMTVASDVCLTHFDGREAVLSQECEGAGKQLIVKCIGEDVGNLKCFFGTVGDLYEHEGDERGVGSEAASGARSGAKKGDTSGGCGPRQVVLCCCTRGGVRLHVLIYLNERSNGRTLKTEWLKDQGVVEVQDVTAGEKHRISLSVGEFGETKMAVGASMCDAHV